MKEEEERIRRLEDEEADRKLREEVDSMQSQFEKEKLTQLQKEVAFLCLCFKSRIKNQIFFYNFLYCW